jgi:hypothetical protein
VAGLMKDRELLSVTEILDDDTGIWAGDLCEYGIVSGDLEDFLKNHGDEGAKEICKMLDELKRLVMEEYLPKSKDNKVSSGTKFNLKKYKKANV